MTEPDPKPTPETTAKPVPDTATPATLEPKSGYQPIEKAPPPKSPVYFVIFIIAIGIIGYAGYNVYQGMSQKPTPPILPTPTVTLSSQPTSTTPLSTETDSLSEPTPADWKTYSDDNLSFTYPKNATITAPPEGETTGVSIIIKGPTQKPQTEFYDGLSLRLKPLDLGDQDLQDYVDTQVEVAENNGVSHIASGPLFTSVNGYTGYRFTDDGYGTQTYYYLETIDGSQAVEITVMVEDPTDQGYEAMVDQILESLELQ